MKKKILIFIQHYIPGTKMGGPIQSIKNICYFLKNDFDIYVYTSNHDFGEKKRYSNVEFDKWIDYDGVKVYYSSKFSINKIRNIMLSNFDWVYLNSIFSFKFSIIQVLINKYFLNKEIPILLAPRGEFNPGAIKFKSLKKKIFLKIINKLEIYKDINFQATASEETKEIKNYLFTNKVIEIPNFKIINNILKINTINKNEIKLIHISRIHPKKNLLFLLDVLLEIKNKKKIKLDIFGPIEDIKYWEECLKKIKKNKNSNININYIGIIDNNKVSKIISQYDYSIFPTLGENYGHVIIESFIAKTPVIVSDTTPWIDLKEKNIGEVLKVNKLIEWRNCILNLEKIEAEEYEKKIKAIDKFIKKDLKIVDNVEKMKFFFSN